MNCKICKEPAIVKISKSAKNAGKEYYACPKQCQGWIGWVDQTLNKPRTPFVPKQPPATPMPNTSPNEPYINEDGEIGCKACGKTCIIKKSSSEKNMGREYFACQDQCNIWNGWVEDSDVISPVTLSRQIILENNVVTEHTANKQNNTNTVKPQSTVKTTKPRNTLKTTKPQNTVKTTNIVKTIKPPNAVKTANAVKLPNNTVKTAKMFNMLPEEF